MKKVEYSIRHNKNIVHKQLMMSKLLEKYPKFRSRNVIQHKLININRNIPPFITVDKNKIINITINSRALIDMQ